MDNQTAISWWHPESDIAMSLICSYSGDQSKEGHCCLKRFFLYPLKLILVPALSIHDIIHFTRSSERTDLQAHPEKKPQWFRKT
jgi:hypothetical protein